MPTLEGRDVSAWQGVLPPEWFARFDFVIIRAFNEFGQPDNTFSANWKNAHGRTRRGAYGFPVHRADNARLAGQLVAVAPDAELGWWADYETTGAGLATPGELETYLHTLAAHGTAGFYSNLAELPRSPYLDAHPWWFANPSNNQPPRPTVIVQYGTVDGVDADRADDQALAALSQGADMPLSDQDLAAIDMHLLAYHDRFVAPVKFVDGSEASLLEWVRAALKVDHVASGAEIAAAVVKLMPKPTNVTDPAGFAAALLHELGLKKETTSAT